MTRRMSCIRLRASIAGTLSYGISSRRSAVDMFCHRTSSRPRLMMNAGMATSVRTDVPMRYTSCRLHRNNTHVRNFDLVGTRRGVLLREAALPATQKPHARHIHLIKPSDDIGYQEITSMP